MHKFSKDLIVLTANAAYVSEKKGITLGINYLIPATIPAGIIFNVSAYLCPMTHVSDAAQTAYEYFSLNYQLRITQSIKRYKITATSERFICITAPASL